MPKQVLGVSLIVEYNGVEDNHVQLEEQLEKGLRASLLAPGMRLYDVEVTTLWPSRSHEGDGGPDIVLSEVKSRPSPKPRPDGRRIWMVREGKRDFSIEAGSAEEAFEKQFPPSKFKVSGMVSTKIGGRGEQRWTFVSDDGRRVHVMEIFGCREEM